MIRLHLISEADIARARVLMAIERAAAESAAMLVKRNAKAAPTIAGIKPRSPLTTNTERKLADLETAVVEGLMTAREADRFFGRKPPGSPGRRRAAGQETFRAWLMRRIAELSDPTAFQKLADRVARAREDRTMSHGKRVALVREINRQSWQHDPEYLGRLRAALAELDNVRQARAA